MLLFTYTSLSSKQSAKSKLLFVLNMIRGCHLHVQHNVGLKDVWRETAIDRKLRCVPTRKRYVFTG